MLDSVKLTPLMLFKKLLKVQIKSLVSDTIKQREFKREVEEIKRFNALKRAKERKQLSIKEQTSNLS